MLVLAGAQPFGFGPVAKLLSLASHLRGMRLTFIGEGIALTYARLNNRHLSQIQCFDLDRMGELRGRVRRHDAVLSVMEPRLVFAAVRERIPVYFLDSLLGFWTLSASLDELAALARVIAFGPEEAASAAFLALPVHEAMVVAHMIATHSFAQTFPGVEGRLEGFRELGFHHVEATGPIIDVDPDLFRRARGYGLTASRTLVVNLGGFSNPFIRPELNGQYIDITLRWLRRLAASTDLFDRIHVCSGAFSGVAVERIGGTEIRTGLLPHRRCWICSPPDPSTSRRRD